MVKKAYFLQNDGHLSPSPPGYLSKAASACWRKIVPFLESTKKVKRIDSGLVEMYCINYEIFRTAYQDVLENGIQTAMYRSLQNSSGDIVGKDFVGYRKNPAVGTMKDVVTQLNSISLQLGLTPKGRQELELLATESESDSSTAEQIAKFFGKEV